MFFNPLRNVLFRMFIHLGVYVLRHNDGRMTEEVLCGLGIHTSRVEHGGVGVTELVESTRDADLCPVVVYEDLELPFTGQALWEKDKGVGLALWENVHCTLGNDDIPNPGLRLGARLYLRSWRRVHKRLTNVRGVVFPIYVFAL